MSSPDHFRHLQVPVCKNGLNSGAALRHPSARQLKGRETQSVFIVQCNPREPGGIRKITTATRKAALEVANDFLKQGMRFVAVAVDGHLYSAEDFAATIPGVREC